VVEKDFREIAHSGGRVIIRTKTDAQQSRGYQLEWNHCRPNAAGLFAIYALAQGVPVAPLPLGGIGSPIVPPPFPGCFQVFIGSDSEGMYGHHCPNCGGYWRDNGAPQFCPYCRTVAEWHQFLSKAQQRYVQQFCAKLREALSAKDDAEYVIDLDAVADAVADPSSEKPAFYYAEESQQNKFTCDACNSITDILGRFAYCSRCGTRNSFAELESKIEPELRKRINAGGQFETCSKEAVSAFDSLVRDYVKQLLEFVPLTQSRRNRLDKRSFQNLDDVAKELRDIFDVRLLHSISDEDQNFARLMFHRRHVYEHTGGEADEKYIQESGDKSVRVKEMLRETQESANRILSIIVRLARNLHEGFHEIIPPDNVPIEQYQKWKPK
jgi:hypothetical protein